MDTTRTLLTALVLALGACDLPPEAEGTPVEMIGVAVTADGGETPEGVDSKPRKPICCRDTKTPAPDGGTK